MKNIGAAIVSFARAVVEKLKNEPVAVANAVTSVIAAGVGLSLYDTGAAAEASAAASAVIMLLGTIFARSRVIPVRVVAAGEADAPPADGV